jgi:hypothetical protein
MKRILLPGILLLLASAAGCREPGHLTVSEVIRNRESLEGRSIRVRGQAFHWLDLRGRRYGPSADVFRLWPAGPPFRGV